ncbi:hypothetical protein USDA257_c25300 [Sinorhizobium fredii USDA 257]|uniref:Uncharacterized protein n=1 Tax=Sinorhizobium fredii (strain USDA 257) TaxID=1185652 RepID=I3X5F0_SINF2|nr:hypothetical protein USDA257_c25300 [Sinorhizobium fredii USDA 257]
MSARTVKASDDLAFGNRPMGALMRAIEASENPRRLGSSQRR